MHFVPELKPRLCFFSCSCSDVRAERGWCERTSLRSRRNYSGPRFHTSPGEASCAGRQRWETGLHLLFAVDNMRMFALDPRRINQNVLTARHKCLFSLFFTRNIILLFRRWGMIGCRRKLNSFKNCKILLLIVTVQKKKKVCKDRTWVISQSEGKERQRDGLRDP